MLKRLGLTLASLAFFSRLALASDDFYVHNQPFQGKMYSYGGKQFVEVEDFAKAINLRTEKTMYGLTLGDGPANDLPAGVIINKNYFPQAFRGIEGEWFAPLDALAEATGNAVIHNEATGITDIAQVKSGLTAARAKGLENGTIRAVPLSQFFRAEGKSLDPGNSANCPHSVGHVLLDLFMYAMPWGIATIPAAALTKTGPFASKEERRGGAFDDCK